jgi:hypothetical protein
MRASVLLCLWLCACVGRVNQEETRAANDALSDCIKHESHSIVRTNTDLETAATAVMARCGSYQLARRQTFTNSIPRGYLATVEPHLREMEAMDMDFARKLIALERTRQ